MSSPDEARERVRLREAERSLYAAMIRKDFAALRQCLSPDLIYVHSTGVTESKAEYLAGVAEGLYQYETIESHAVDVRIHGKVAVLSGTVDMLVGERGGPKGLIHLLFVLLWVERNGTWQLDYRQATRRR
jgi:ketosteroid isomerase-like protein